MPPPPPPAHAPSAVNLVQPSQTKRTKGGAAKNSKRKAKSKQGQAGQVKKGHSMASDPWLDFEGPPGQHHAAIWSNGGANRFPQYSRFGFGPWVPNPYIGALDL